MRVTAHGWWLEEAGAVEARPPLAGERRADVVILGGGYTGMWTAWHLAERGVEVALLESGVCGEGPSGRNGGFVDHLAHAAPRLREIAGDDAARATIAASIESVERIGKWCTDQRVDAWFHRGGQIVASAAPAQDGSQDEAVAACEALGLADELRPLSAAEVAARCASPMLRGGAFARSTATVQPARLARGLRARLLDRGVQIFERSRVTALRGTVAETGAGRVHAGAAVLAIGGRAIAAKPLRRRLTMTSSHLVITEPMPGLLERLGWTGGEAITDSRHLVHYFRTTPGGRIAFGWGGGRIVCGARLQPRDDADRNLALQVARDLSLFFPDDLSRQIRPGRVVHAWGGPIDASPQHLPIVDTLPGGRAHVAFGYTGNGVGPSELCGRILARMALDERDELTRLPIVGQGGPLLPPEPLRVAGGAAIRAALERKESAEEAGRAPSGLARAVASLPHLLGVEIGR